MAEQKSPVYVGIPDHVDVRRGLLLSSKDLISSLKAYELVKELRVKRAELTFELHKVMDELAVLTKKTRLNLPKPPAKLVLEEREPEPEKTMKKSKRAGEDKLGALDTELSKIEARLKKI